jgi:hypothetical protein
VMEADGQEANLTVCLIKHCLTLETRMNANIYTAVDSLKLCTKLMLSG